MAYQTVFKRYELKYMIDKKQKEAIILAMAEHMIPDGYGRSTIRNVYFDNDSYRLIRRSLERPDYKEKLRIRSYARADGDSTVFVEIKKKYNKVVYKRRVSMPLGEAMDWLTGVSHPPLDTQIVREIDYFMSFYATLSPKVFLSYEREAYYGKNDPTFRVTFDENILARTNELSLDAEPHGEKLLPDGKVLMEIKCTGGIPLWMSEILSREKIYKTSFSKYGTAYGKYIFPKLKGEQTNG